MNDFQDISCNAFNALFSEKSLYRLHTCDESRQISYNIKRVKLFQVLNNIIRIAKKPVVIAATKCDEANEVLVRELERLVNRKDLKQLNIPVVETSSHEGTSTHAFLWYTYAIVI